MHLKKYVRRKRTRFLVLSIMLLLVAAFSAYVWRSEVPPAGGDVLSVNIDPSSSLGEEVWRMRLRRMHRRQDRLRPDDGFVDRPSLPASVPLQASSSSVPPRLASSGIDYRLLLLPFLALYTVVLHERAKRLVVSS